MSLKNENMDLNNKSYTFSILYTFRILYKISTPDLWKLFTNAMQYKQKHNISLDHYMSILSMLFDN